MGTDGDTWDLCVLLSKHTRLNDSIAAHMCSAAFVCMRRHHAPPRTIICVSVDSNERTHALAWQSPTERDVASNNSNQDAACYGAYAVALVCVEQKLSLYAIGRAEDRTGADWYVAPADFKSDTSLPNMDDPSVIRLEVGGFNNRSLPHELKKKIDQLHRGDSGRIGIAAVVGFDQAKVLIQTGVAPGTSGGGAT